MAIILMAVVSWLYVTDKLVLVDTHKADKSFSQFITLKGLDEYVIAGLESNEEFTTEIYKQVMGYPVGDTHATVSLVAHYKYYIKLAELSHTVEKGVVFVHVPKLYLSTPVAFDFSTVREICNKSWFGTDCEEILGQLKKEVSEKLLTKGKLQVGVVYDKAAKALADNLNAYFGAQGYGRYYKDIVVTFASERGESQRQFHYNKSYCGNEACLLELDLGQGRVFAIE